MTRTQDVVTTMVRFLLAEQRESQAQLADALGIAGSGITARFHGRTRWSVDDIDALADHFGVTPEQLVEGTIRARELGPKPVFVAQRRAPRTDGLRTTDGWRRDFAASYELAA